MQYILNCDINYAVCRVLRYMMEKDNAAYYRISVRVKWLELNHARIQSCMRNVNFFNDIIVFFMSQDLGAAIVRQNDAFAHFEMDF